MRYDETEIIEDTMKLIFVDGVTDDGGAEGDRQRC